MKCRIAYVVSISMLEHVKPFTDGLKGLAWETLFASASNCVVVVESAFEHEAAAQDLWDLVDDDIQLLSERWPSIGERRPSIDGRPIGSRWPVIWVQDSESETGPANVSAEVKFDHAILRQASRDEFRSICSITGLALSRFRSCAENVEACQEILDGLSRSAEELLSTEVEDRLRTVLQESAVNLILTDPTPIVYWGYQVKYITDLRESWQMSRAEYALDRIQRSTEYLISDFRESLASAELLNRQRQVKIANSLLVAISVSNLVAAVLALLSFAVTSEQFSITSVWRALLSVSIFLAAMGAIFLIRITSAPDRPLVVTNSPNASHEQH